MVFVNVNIAKQMVVGALLLLVAMSGCNRLDTETPRGWPPAPEVPPGVGTTHGAPGGGCVIFGIDVYRPSGETIVLDVPTQTAKEHANDWPDADLEMIARSPWGTYEDLFPEPVVLDRSEGPELAYRFVRPDPEAEDEAKNDAILLGIEPGRWYPWEMAGSVKSGASGLNGYGLLASGEAVARGWVLVDAHPGDDKLWFSGPDGTVETRHTYPVPLPDGYDVGFGRIHECP